jgi:hypothetical protein
MDALTKQTLELVEKIKSQQTAEKSYTTALGLNWYDLEPAAKLLYPVITPLRNMIARVPANGGTATNWKALTALDTTNEAAGVSEGNRGSVITTSEQDFVAPYRGLGKEDYETWEAEYGSKNFDDLRALMTNGLLNATMISEEKTIIGGNGSDGIALGTPATPALSKVGGAGTLGAITVSVKVVALTLDGWNRATIAAGVKTQFVRTNADATTDTINGGSSNKSAAATLALSAGDVVTATVTAIKGAYGYAWYWGTAGNELIGAITTVNKVTFSAAAAGTQNVSAVTADNSKDSLVFSGFATQALSSTGYWASQDGAILNGDGAGGITEIETALKAFWDNNKVSPDIMLVNSQELLNISKKVVAGGAAPLFRFTVDGAQSGQVNSLTLTAGSVVGYYLNKYAMNSAKIVRVMLHPNIPPGIILFYSQQPPYETSRLRNTIQMKVRKEYYQIEWALRSRKYEAGVYVDELLQVYAPFMFGAIGNILNG